MALPLYDKLERHVIIGKPKKNAEGSVTNERARYPCRPLACSLDDAATAVESVAPRLAPSHGYVVSVEVQTTESAVSLPSGL